MGMTIDESIDYLSDENTRLKLSASDKDAIDRIISAYLIIKANYNERLKADMVAMLEEINKEMNLIKECEHQIYGKEHWNFVGKCQDVVQQKIDALKEVVEDGSANN